MGVFRISNHKNNKMFIDSSTDMNARWNRHKTELKQGTHRNKELQTDWKKDGEESFSFEILAELEPIEDKTVNYRKELKILQAMVLAELNTDMREQY